MIPFAAFVLRAALAAGSSAPSVDVVVSAADLSAPAAVTHAVEASCAGVRYCVTVRGASGHATVSLQAGRNSRVIAAGPLRDVLAMEGPADVRWLCHRGGAALIARVIRRGAAGPPNVMALRAYFRGRPDPVEVSVHEQALDTAF